MQKCLQVVLVVTISLLFVIHSTQGIPLDFFQCPLLQDAALIETLPCEGCFPPCKEGYICCPGGIQCASYCLKRRPIFQSRCPSFDRALSVRCSSGLRVGSECVVTCRGLVQQLANEEVQTTCTSFKQWSNRELLEQLEEACKKENF